jgi:hypothetical protein
MFEQTERILKIACAGLAVVLIAQLTRLVFHAGPLGEVRIPPLPVWRSGSPSDPKAATGKPAAQGPAVFAHGGLPGMSMVPPGISASHAEVSLSPAAQQRIDRIAESGLLGPVIRPPPMALIGIAGEHVLLRAPNGQSGLLKEGEELGGVKLLRIGTNRVLVEENGQPKELSIFEGLGGESLMPKAKEGTP